MKEGRTQSIDSIRGTLIQLTNLIDINKLNANWKDMSTVKMFSN